jgi:hypothetical protein
MLVFSQNARDVIFRINQYKTEVKQLQQEKDSLDWAIGHGRIIWGVGEPILLWTSNPQDPSRVIKSELLSALSTANGMSIAKNDKIASQQNDPPLPADTQLVVIDDQQLEAKVRAIQQRNQVTGIRIVAARNCLYREPVQVHLELQPVRLVFRKGEVVARKVVHKSNSAQFLREWYGFLTLMKKNALKSGMEEINDSLGGGLTNEDFERLIKEISVLKGGGELYAVAKRDIYETTPLDVQVEMRGVPAAQGIGKR